MSDDCTHPRIAVDGNRVGDVDGKLYYRTKCVTCGKEDWMRGIEEGEVAEYTSSEKKGYSYERITN